MRSYLSCLVSLTLPVALVSCLAACRTTQVNPDASSEVQGKGSGNKLIFDCMKRNMVFYVVYPGDDWSCGQFYYGDNSNPMPQGSASAPRVRTFEEDGTVVVDVDVTDNDGESHQLHYLLAGGSVIAGNSTYTGPFSGGETASFDVCGMRGELPHPKTKHKPRGACQTGSSAGGGVGRDEPRYMCYPIGYEIECQRTSSGCEKGYFRCK